MLEYFHSWPCSCTVPLWVSFPKLATLPLILVELLLLCLCEFGPLSDFGARKLCHSFSGLLMLHLDPGDYLARWFVYSVAVSSLLMVWEIGVNFKFRYSNTRDIGISVYLVLVVVFFYHQIPLEIIKPVFFADPLGALVGRHLTQAGCWNPAWIGQNGWRKPGSIPGHIVDFKFWFQFGEVIGVVFSDGGRRSISSV